MRNRILTILLFSGIAMMYQSCDSTMNIDKPKDFYKYVGGDGDQTGVDFVTDTEGNVYILGSSLSTDTVEAKLGTQLFVSMTNSRGEVQWQETYGDRGQENPKDIEMLNDGSLVLLANWSDSVGTEKDIVIYRISKTDGTQLTTRFQTTTPGVPDYGNSITQTLDGGFIVAGYKDNGSFKSYLVYRLTADMQFDPDWVPAGFDQRDDLTGYDVVPMKVLQRADNIFYIFGYTNTIQPTTSTSEYNYFARVVNELDDPLTGFFFIPNPDTTAFTNEHLTSIQEVPDQSGIGYILTGTSTDFSGSQQSLYVVRVVPDLQSGSVRPDKAKTFIIDSRLITPDATAPFGSFVTVSPAADKGFLLLANQGISGDNNLYLTKINKELDDEWTDDGAYRLLGGIGDDAAGAVAETADGRILVVGTMVLGDLKGQRKIVLVNLSSDGRLGN